MPLINPQIRANVAPTLTNSAYGFGVGESTRDRFVGVTIDEVFRSPRPATAAPTTAGDYRLNVGSRGIDAGDDSLVVGSTDLAGNQRIQGPAVDMGAFEFPFLAQPRLIIRRDGGIGNGINSNALVPLSYGPFKRGEAVELAFLVRNIGELVLTLGELGLPAQLSLSGDPLPESLASFEDHLLTFTVDTSVAGMFETEITLASNDPDAHENPFVINLVIYHR
ncbi:MAG: choice-of-anchor Q domain-containing protein [Deinococcota bacterium]